MSRFSSFMSIRAGSRYLQPMEIVRMFKRLFTLLLLSIAMLDAHADTNSEQGTTPSGTEVVTGFSLWILETDAVFAAPAGITLQARGLNFDSSINSVAFYNGSTLLAQVPASGDMVSFSWGNVPIGSYTLNAVGTRDDGTTVATAPLTVRVAANVAPSISITSPVNNTPLKPGTIPLRVNTSDAVGHVTNVVYYRDGVLIVDDQIEPWAYNWQNVQAGTYTITAKAIDDKGASTMSAPVTLIVQQNSPPSVTLTATLTGSTVPGTIALSASASDSDGSITKVEFFNGSTLLATITQAPYSYTWSNVPAGSYSLTARATDNLGGVTSTQPSVVTVGAESSGAQIYYVYADQVNTPREVTNAAGQLMWRADTTEPFGANAPNENPANQGTFIYNARFPGQYFDNETGLHYNYFRDYDPGTGRFVQSDPIGLRGGINTFRYVQGNPISYSDALGLEPDQICVAACTVAGGLVGGTLGEGAGALVGSALGGGGGTLVAPGPGTIGGAIAGGALGSSVGGMAGAAGGAWAGNVVGNAMCPDDKECSPPAGTKCYVGPDTTHSHAGLNPHYHIFQMFKFNGQCQWKYLGGKVGKGVLAIPPDGMAPCSSYAGFQGR